MEEMTGMLSQEERDLACEAVETALSLGADKARITLNKSLMDLYGTLDGKLDKVSHCLDRSMGLSLFLDGRFGTFSTNRLDRKQLKSFVREASEVVKMLAPDPCRNLPDTSRTEKGALTGDELQLLDSSYSSMTPDKRLTIAMEASVFQKHKAEGLISEEGEYSDSIFDTLIVDTNGLYCRHTETSFEYGVEMTVMGGDGEKISGYWWDAAPMLSDLKASGCGDIAFRRAVSHLNPKPVSGGKYNMVVDNECSTRLVTPLMTALGAYSLQQKNSFLMDSLGKRIFPEWLTIEDRPRSVGETGSRLFDSEGVTVPERPVILNGVVKEYFVNTYMAAKMGIEPTVEDVTRPAIPPCHDPSYGIPKTFDRQGLMDLMGDGILVTGFNGGNSNPATGDFSFGIEGFLFKDGKTVHPVREMLVTGNFLQLWNNLAASGEDYRLCKSKLIPTLAFRNIDFSA